MSLVLRGLDVLKIGLTGGIGSGKSTVAAYFQALGVPVIDADEIARQVVEPDLPTFREIVRAFGDEILNGFGRIDRARLRQTVFDNEADRKRLEAILHPKIREIMRKEVSDLDAPYCILVIPLLLEANQQDMVDHILVVDADDEKRIRWLQARDGLSEKQIKKITAAQMDRRTRIKAADDCIHNKGSLDDLAQAVAGLHKRYLALAKQADG